MLAPEVVRVDTRLDRPVEALSSTQQQTVDENRCGSRHDRSQDQGGRLENLRGREQHPWPHPIHQHAPRRFDPAVAIAMGTKIVAASTRSSPELAMML